MSKNQTRKPLEIKISTVVAVAALIGDTDLDKLSSALAEVTGGTPDYFEDEFTVIDLYARGGDLVILATVNPGAEVIADGSIHVYAPLRGRALAGAAGASDARIIGTCMEAELVSIAGVYRTFDDGWPKELKGKPVQVLLQEDRLDLRPMALK
ncbi:MAG: septum site-determining protein MinC [Oxalobacteraceae bacterium]|nr:septum site-determining protein MinC [Oxalobacteraceae bacterium]